MKKKLWLLNLALMAAGGAAGWQLRERWRRAEERERALTEKASKPLPPRPAVVQPLAPAEPIAAASYAEIAQKTLFSRDRNPTVVVVAPPPPPKPTPPFPRLYGVLALGDSATVLLSDRPGGPQRGVRIGEMAGEFRLLAANSREVVFGWDGKEFRKTLDELMDRSPAAVAAAGAIERTATPAPAASASGVVTPKGVTALGVFMGTNRACVAGDPAPAGTVLEGYRKIVEPSPFGTLCRWEPMK